MLMFSLNDLVSPVEILLFILSEFSIRIRGLVESLMASLEKTTHTETESGMVIFV